jgi:tetratricopeptide (TPR) repeat protein
MKKSFSYFTVGCLELILLVGSCAATPKTEQLLAQQRQVTPSIQNSTKKSLQTEPKLRGIPLACYVRVGPLGFLPSSVSSSLSMLANEESTELAEIALAYAQAKQFQSAIAITKKMGDQLIQAVTLVDIAGMYTAAGQYTKAKQLVNSIQGYDTFKSQLLARIAREYAKAGKPQQASPTFMQALRVARTLDARTSLAVGYADKIPSLSTFAIA